MIKKYEQYRDSDVKWIGEIPLVWKLVKLKHFAKVAFSSVDRHEKENELEVKICHYPDAYKNEIIDFETKISKGTCSQNEFDKFQLKEGQVIITKDSESPNDIGIPTYINKTFEEAVCGYHLAQISVEQDNLIGKFLFRYLQTKNVSYFFETNSNGVTRFGLGKKTIQNLVLPLPSIFIQTKIAQYLDYQTGLIDAIIERKQLLIEKLKEQRQAIINETVTKGLDPNAPMKDSGVEWIGKIPEHWKNKNLKYLGSFQNGVSNGAEYFGTGLPFLSYGDVYKNEILPSKVKGLANSTKEERERFSIEKGDVFFTRTSETIEEIGISSVCFNNIPNSVFAGFLIRFRPIENSLYSGFSRFYFRSSVPRIFFVREMNLVTRASLSQELLKRLPVMLPDYEEQIKIAEHLEFKTQKIDEVILKTKQGIEQLKLFRQSIISEAVTGKIDVREWELRARETA